MSNKPLLYLHIGTHKTGTTSIQKFGAKHRDALRERGLYYPKLVSDFGPRNPGHHHFAHALSDDGSPSCSEADAMRFLEEIGADVQEHEAILLSAEPFYRHTRGRKSGGLDHWSAKKAYVENLRDALEPFMVKVIVYLRRQDSFARSLFKESVLQSGFAGEFQAYVEERRDTFDYYRQMSLWADAFGRGEIIYQIYDPSVRGAEHLSRFFNVMDVKVADLDKSGGAEMNVSLNDDFVELKRRLNANRYQGGQHIHVRKALESLAERPAGDALVRAQFELENAPFPELEFFVASNQRLRNELAPELEGFEDFTDATTWNHTYPRRKLRNATEHETFADLVHTLISHSAKAQADILADTAWRLKRDGHPYLGLTYAARAIQTDPAPPGRHDFMLDLLRAADALDRLPGYIDVARKSLTPEQYKAYKARADEVLAKAAKTKAEAAAVSDSSPNDGGTTTADDGAPIEAADAVAGNPQPET